MRGASGRNGVFSGKQLSLAAGKALWAAGIKGADVRVFLLPGREIGRLKAEYYRRRRGKEADVLSFAEPRGFPHPESRKKVLGEVYLNRDLLRLRPERALPLLVHGILHILGYTHVSGGDTMKMERREKNILAKLSPSRRRST